MIQVLDKYGNTNNDEGRVLVFDKDGNIKRLGGGGGTGTVTSIATSAPITGGTITTTGTIGITKATASSDGYLSSTDWNTFNSKGSGTVTSVGLSNGTGISLSGTNPITTSGTITITNSAPDQTVVLNNGTGISVTGTYPNFTITNSNPFTSPLTTKGDIYVRNGSADTRLPVGLDTQVLLADSTTSTGLKWGSNTTPPASGYYGAFSDITDQTAAAINTGYPMLLGVTDLSNGVTVVSGSRVTIANTGIYNIQWSAQFTNPTAAEHDVTIWLRKNGVDVPGSSGIVLVPPKHGSADGHTLPSWNFLLDAVGGDYYEFVWSTVNTSVYISFEPAGSPPPSTASVVLTVTQQSGIMAGTGITAINSLTGAVQTLGTGTSGTDFAITSSGTSHTFDLPTASSTNRGALSTSDWTNFNTAYTNRITSLTTTGSSGSATLSSNTLNIPTYTLSGLGGQPLATNLTSLSGLSYASTSFVKMTASGTFSLDTNTYLTSVGTGTTNEITYWSGTNTIGSLTTATYPSLTELSYVKGVTSAIQTQINNKFTLPSLTSGSILFSNGTTIAQDNSNLFWDDTNNRLGVGTASPGYTVDVQGSIPTTSSNIFVIKNTNAALSTSPTLALDCSGTQPDQPVEIRLASSQPKGLRMYASNTDLAAVSTGASLQLFSNSSTNFPGQFYFDGGSHNSSSIIFRTAQTSGTITQRMRIFANGNVSVSSSATDAGFLLNVAGTGRFTSALTTAGQLTAFSAKTSAYSLLATDQVISADATSAAFNVTLPTAVSKTGQTYTIKRINSNANVVTVATTSSQTIDGATTYALSAQYKYVTVVSNGANWLIIANN